MYTNFILAMQLATQLQLCQENDSYISSRLRRELATMGNLISYIFNATYRDGSRLLKRGNTTKTVIIVDVGLQLAYLHSQCAKQTGMQSMPVLGSLGSCPPGNFEKLHLLRLKLRVFLVIYQPLMFLQTQVHKLLKMYYLHAYPCWVMLQKLLYIKIVMLLYLLSY